MDAYQCMIRKLDVRQFAKRKVPPDVKEKILEAARATGSSMNTQHWRFILVRDSDGLARLAADSTTGGWVAGADFAVVILANPKVPGYQIDVGRALQDMELAAWNFGVASCLFTGFRQADVRSHLAIPPALEVSAALGFGYPARRVVGRKNRKPLEELIYLGRYGTELKSGALA